ncbi:DUF4402 domain-containing protein [Pseudoalteromonas luteoviolacea]|uniref:DUF4402 domain-containing protein n=1 Tax=Pseudoalteromonas luteoviolacea TaxID=43657 RepID=UPI001F408420|nr:DUF4402 domain-containing protein [Pseudoalteromonas luteoviolacea]MCF6438111.1 DUF4402 domain-containing protein [Pseudoalteromonas luteoviolacea]
MLKESKYKAVQSIKSRAAVFGLCLIVSLPVLGRIDVLTPLDFGTILISDHSQTSRVKIGVNGQNTTSGAVHLVSGGNAAELALSSLPPLHQISVSTSIVTPLLSHSNLYVPGINLVQLEHINSVVSDSQGNAALKIGGTIEVSAQPSQFPDGTYRVWANIELNY